jgi:hypothetical protein
MLEVQNIVQNKNWRGYPLAVEGMYPLFYRATYKSKHELKLESFTFARLLQLTALPNPLYEILQANKTRSDLGIALLSQAPCNGPAHPSL